MLKTSLILLTAIAVFAQSPSEHVVFQGSTTLKSGIVFKLRSVVTGSDTPPTAWDATGVRADGDVVHRYATNWKDGTYFGYDARIEYDSNKGEYRVTLGPVSDYGPSMKPLPQPTFPAPQTLHEGDTMELDLLVSADGKVKLTDSFTLAAGTPAPAVRGPQAQTQVTCAGQNCTFTISFNDPQSWLYNGVTTGASYSGQWQMDTARTLPDGTHTSNASSGPMIYRDSKGRVRSERHAYPGAGANGQPARPGDFIIAQIQDPVAGYQYILDPVLHIAHRMAFLPESVRRWDPTSVTQMATAPSSGLLGRASTTFLGTQTISGVVAYGQKMTFTRTAQDGTVVNTNERWEAPNSGAEILAKDSSNGPNGFVATRSMPNYSEAEPAAALFQVPDGYQTVDETGPFQVVHPNPGGGGSGLRGPQLTNSCEDGVCNITFDPGTIAATPVVTGAPYSGKEVILNSRMNVPRPGRSAYRDSNGRVRGPAPTSGPQMAGSGSPSLVQIEDPVAGYLYILNASTETAYRIKTAFRSYAFQPLQGLGQQPGTNTAPNGRTQTTENLPSQTISGVTALGQRTTITYPPGTFNQNDKTVIMMNERWVDPKTGVAILTKSSQPTGDITSSIPDYREGDPDPALFQVPSNYTIIDETGKFTFTTPAVAGN